MVRAVVPTTPAKKGVAITAQTRLLTAPANAKSPLHRLARVDNPHARARQQSVKQTGQPVSLTAKPNFLKNRPKIVRPAGRAVNRPTPAPIQRPTKTTQTTRKQSAPSTSIVAWEVDDFKWPSVITKMNKLNTQIANAMAEAAFSSLSAADQRLAVIGSGRGPGTTTIAMYIARVLAARGKQVLLVDADLSKPELTQRLGIPATMSWTNVINENRKCCEAIIRSNTTGICVMPVAKISARVTWPDYVYDCLAGILDAVRKNFDAVIMDMGPTSQVIRELSRPKLLVDAAMLVHNAKVNDRNNYSRNQTELNSFGIKKLVVAENFVARRAA